MSRVHYTRWPQPHVVRRHVIKRVVITSPNEGITMSLYEDSIAVAWLMKSIPHNIYYTFLLQSCGYEWIYDLY